MSRKATDDAIALRKQLIQMRLELNRQKIHHETLVLLEPVEKLRRFKQRLSQGSTPLLVVAGATLVGFLMSHKGATSRNAIPLLKIVASLLPFIISSSSSTRKPEHSAPNPAE